MEDIPEEQKAEMIAILKAHHVMKKRGIRSQAKAQIADVKNTVQRVSNEVRTWCLTEQMIYNCISATRPIIMNWSSSLYDGGTNQP